MSPGEGTKAFTVLRTDQLVRPADEGGMEFYYRVRIKTRGGTNLDIFIDERDYTAEKIEPILRQQAQESDKILHL